MSGRFRRVGRRKFLYVINLKTFVYLRPLTAAGSVIGIVSWNIPVRFFFNFSLNDFNSIFVILCFQCGKLY